MDQYDVHRRPCVIYQYFTDLPMSDRFEVFRGEVWTPIAWSEGDRDVSFEVVSKIYSYEVGFTPEEGQYASIPIELTGVAWPLAFGGCVHIPAVKRAEVIQGSTLTTFGLPDATLDAQQKLIDIQMEKCQSTYNFYENFIGSLELSMVKFGIKKLKIFVAGPVTAWTLNYNGKEVATFDANVTASDIETALINNTPILPNTTADITQSGQTYFKTFEITFSDPVVDMITVDNVEFPPGAVSQTTPWFRPYVRWEYGAVHYRGTDITSAESVRQLVSNVASDTQRDYVQSIITEDKAKQTIEDLNDFVTLMNKQVDAKIQEMNELTDGSPEFLAAKAIVLQIKADRDVYLNRVTAAHKMLEKIKITQHQLKTDIHNQKYVFTQISKIREKMSHILTEMEKLDVAQRKLDNARISQEILNINQVLVSGGYRFPQGTALLVDVEGVLINGFFNNNVFVAQSYLPSQTNVFIGPRLDDSPDKFWIVDPSIVLRGKYCRLDDDRIIKVTEQTGTECKFELQEIQNNDRFKELKFTYNGPNAAEIQQGLSNLLVGGESQEELMRLANTVPKDLSHQIKQKLIGETTRQVLHIENASFGTFTITYDNYETALLQVGSTASEVYTAIKDLLVQIDDPYLGQAGQFTQSMVTGGPLLTQDISIDIGKPIHKPFGVNSVGLSKIDKSLTITLKCEGEPTGGTWKGYYPIPTFPGQTGPLYSSFTLPWNATAQQVATYLQPYLGPTQVTVSGGPFPAQDIQIKFLDKRHYTAFLPYDINLTGGEKATIIAEGQDTGLAVIYVDSDGAHEYTVRERQKKLDDVFTSSQYEDAIKKQKNIIKGALKTINENGIKKADIIAAQADLANNLTQYKKLISQLQTPDSLLDEVNRYISKDEYEDLFELELLNFLNWRRRFTPITPKYEDPSEKYYITGQQINFIKEVSAIILPEWVNTITESTNPDPYEADFEVEQAIAALPSTQAWNTNPGTVIKIFGPLQETFVANILPSTVHGVYAYRSIEGTRTLVPVPSSYYVKNEAANYGIMTATTITMIRPLQDYPNENWDNQIYVTLTSSVGPNICEIIEWIVNTYTNLTIDSSSFATVAAQVDNYPANFCIRQQKDAIQMINEIAYQSRCATWVKGNKLYIRYLSATPSPVDTITESDVDFKSLEMTYSTTEDIITVYKARWQDRYDIDRKYTLSLRANITKYFQATQEYDYYIYNNYYLVEKSATFWLIRRSNTWKKIKFRTYLTKLKLETMDPVTIDFSNGFFSNDPVTGIIEKADYDSSSNMINMEVWLPVRAGEMDEFSYAWPSSISASLFWPPADFITAGNAGNPIGGAVPIPVAQNPYDPNVLAIRPKDYGTLKPSDIGDVKPQNPASEFQELNYSAKDIESTDKVKPVDLAKKTPPGLYFDWDQEQLYNFNRTETDPFMGRVLRKITPPENAPDPNEMPDNADPDVTVEVQYYEVLGPDNRKYKVRQIQIHPDDYIPSETVVHVTWNPYNAEYEMQVPIYLGDPLDEVNDENGGSDPVP